MLADLFTIPAGDLDAVAEPWAAFSELEQDVWAPAPKTTVSKYADANRILSGPLQAEPGKFETDRTPYLREPMDAMGDREIELLAIVKPAQVGGSLAWENGLFYWEACDPGPCLLVMPDQDSAEELIDERIAPMVESIELDQDESDPDITTKKVRLSSMDIYVAWATSPAKLARRPCRYVIFDEVNKYPNWSGKDANPIALGKARVRTFKRRAKIVLVSTPTYRTGQITVAYEACDDRRVHEIPCVHCGAFFAPTFGTVRWPKEIDSNDLTSISRIEAEGLACLECPHCKGVMGERERLSVLKLGRYRSNLAEGQKGRSVGFRFGVLSTPWSSVHWVAAKFLRVRNDPEKLFEFVTQDLGEEFEEQQKKIDAGQLAAKVEAAALFPRRVVPAWAGFVAASADSQKNGFPWILRAFGKGHRSRLVDFGHARTLAELKILTIDRVLQVEDSDEVMVPVMLLIDARGGTSAAEDDGSRTDQVYRFALTDNRIRPVMGYGGNGRPAKAITEINTNYTPPGGDGYRVTRWMLDSVYFKDVLESRINNQDPKLWEICAEADEDYLAQMQSEHKVIERAGKTMRSFWKKKSDGRANHYWDCEYQACAAGVMAVADVIPEEKALREQRRRRSYARARAPMPSEPFEAGPAPSNAFRSPQPPSPGSRGDGKRWVDGRGWNR